MQSWLNIKWEGPKGFNTFETYERKGTWLDTYQGCHSSCLLVYSINLLFPTPLSFQPPMKLITCKGVLLLIYLEKLVKRDASCIALQFTHTAFFTHLLIAFYVFSKSATRFQQKRDVFDASWCNWFINFSRYGYLLYLLTISKW